MRCFFLTSIIFLASCSSINKFLNLQDDNPIEESVECLIESKTGLDIDLTPESKE